MVFSLITFLLACICAGVWLVNIGCLHFFVQYMLTNLDVILAAFVYLMQYMLVSIFRVATVWWTIVFTILSVLAVHYVR
jgi:hypothetical protein